MKGILLAGGTGSRLHPATHVMSKQLLPIYDKPMIFYPLSILMLAGLREILVITTPRDLAPIRSLLGDGSALGLKLSYAEQAQPNGIAEAFLIGEEFLAGDSVCLILGDNIFHGHELTQILSDMSRLEAGAQVFAYHVTNPGDYGVVEFDRGGRAISLEEKPVKPKSQWAVTGLYFYDGRVSELTRRLCPSARGELEITDLNRIYLDAGQLRVRTIGRGVAWLDTGTPEALLKSSQFVETLETRQGLKIACLEEIAYVKRFITREQLVNLAERMPKCAYGDYLRARVVELE